MRARSKAIIVTAADQSIGRAVAVWLGERGFRVLAVGTDAAAMVDLPRETAPGGLIETLVLALDGEASCERAVARCVTVYGELDGVVCAGGSARFGPVEEIDDAAVRELFEDNFFQPLRLVRVAAASMRLQGHGTIVAISTAAGRIALPMSGPYSSSRYALEGLCDALRLELGVFGVNVVLVEPGLLRAKVGAASTPRDAQSLFGVEATSPYAEIGQVMAEAYRQLSRRAGTPDDVARVVERVLRTARPKPRYAVSRGTAALLLARKLLADRVLDTRLARAIGLDD